MPRKKKNAENDANAVDETDTDETGSDETSPDDDVAETEPAAAPAPKAKAKRTRAGQDAPTYVASRYVAADGCTFKSRAGARVAAKAGDTVDPCDEDLERLLGVGVVAPAED